MIKESWYGYGMSQGSSLDADISALEKLNVIDLGKNGVWMGFR